MNASSNKTIVFVEDEPTLQEAMTEVLVQEGYQVEEASNGEEGLQRIKELKPALVLLDLILPKMDGFDVLTALQSDEDLAPIPVIVLTNLEGMGDVEKALSLGAKTYLVKANYDLEDIVNKVRDTIGATA